MKEIYPCLLKVIDVEKTFIHLQEDALYNFIPDKKYSNLEDLKIRYQQLINGSKNKNEIWLNWLIFKDSNRKNPIGTMQATLLKDEQKAYLGYVIYKKYWHLGYGTAALNWLIQHLEKIENINYLEAYVDINNKYSIKILEKFYFENIGILGSDFIFQRLCNKRL